MKVFFLFCTLIISACSSLPKRSPIQESNVEYYYGDVIFFSPDEKTIYGKSVSLVKRIIDPSNNTITEIVEQPPRDRKQQPINIRTVLTRLGNLNIFSAIDDGHTFSGSLSFSGSEWNWDKWTYEIKMSDGSKLDGIGFIDAAGLKTQKTFYKPDGKASVKLKENLNTINSAEYDIRHKEISNHIKPLN